MKYETRQVRIGEWLDIPREEWARIHREVRPDDSDDIIEQALQIADEPRTWAITIYDISERVIKVGIYDGWSCWRPRLAYLCEGPCGAEVKEAYNVRRAYRVKDCSECNGYSRNCPKVFCRGFRREIHD